MNRLKSILLLLLVSLLVKQIDAQITIEITNAQDFPDSICSHVFVAGNFNGWNPADEKTKFKRVGDRLVVTLDLSVNLSVVEYKFTAGSWDRGEVMENGTPRANRTCYYKPGMIVSATVENFQHLAPHYNPQENTAIIKFEVWSPELKCNKNIRVYLPKNYAVNTNRYPVLYMLDGQNLFDATTSYAGEWGIDEAMDSIANMNQLPAIIIGIDNAGEDRLAEYSPFLVKNEVESPKGDDFAKFVAVTLKPKIDSMYRTLAKREFNGVIGSSMGGVESMYIVLKYSNLFSKAGVFSPSFWTSKKNYEYAAASVIKSPTQFYFLAGAFEGGDYEMMNDMHAMYQLLLDKKNPNLILRAVVESDGTHGEGFWSEEFLDMYNWFFIK